MARTQLPTTLIADETIVRADLNVSTSGSAVIRRLIQGSGITISSTGVDTGTGDVTVSLNTSGLVTSFNTRTGAVTLTNSDVTSALGFTPISGYTETDTLNSVTTRGATTANSITVGGVTTSGTVTANSLVKSGGTSAQILMADGSVVTAGAGITISGGLISAAASSGITTLNTLTTATQTFAVGTTGTDFNIASAAGVHTFHIPDASSSARGLVTTGSQSFVGVKVFTSGLTATNSNTNFYIPSQTAASPVTFTEALFTGSTTVNTRVVTAIGSSSTVLTVNANYAGTILYGGLATEAASGTHNIIAGVVVRPVNLTTGAATATNGATLYIEGPAIGTAAITNSYSLWVDAGAVRFDGTLEVQGQFTGTTAVVQEIKSSTGNLKFKEVANNLTATVFDTTGNWVIQTGGTHTDLGYKLYVAGSIYSTSDIIAFSDRRVKTNIRTIPTALAKVLQMRGVFYEPILHPGTGDRVGVIAQEIEEVLPEVVTTDKNGMKGVMYQNIVGVLIEAIKEQNQKIKQLEELINELA